MFNISAKMDSLHVKHKTRLIPVIYVLAVFYSTCGLCDSVPYYTSTSISATTQPAPSPTPTIHLQNVTAHVDPVAANITKQSNATDDSNRTTNVTKTTALPAVVSVTQIPLLGVNGTGQRHDLAANTPLVSDPIKDDDESLTDVIKETPEMIKAQQNIHNLTYDHHNFYNSTFIGNRSFFDDYWANITQPKAEIHTVLSSSHRKATNQKLSFEFPFYGHAIHNVTVATGGFIYTGDHVHHWLAATQYIAPLMSNFDTTLTNTSLVKYSDDGEKFTVFWEKVPLQEDPTKQFTFAVTLYKRGDIVFAYKDIPMNISMINDSEHPVKVGISDAYLTDKIIMYVRRKTIYEYHRVSFKNHEIMNGTILWLTALPTCLSYNTCESCANHQTGFECAWCDAIQKCSSGTDRNKQDWLVRNCERSAVSKAAGCPAPRLLPPGATAYGNGPDVTDNTSVVTKPDVAVHRNMTRILPAAAASDAHSPIGGVVAEFLVLALVCTLAAWLLYAFKNPHTRSGQLLIKYRPSQWSWRRGEARYTAATIHM